MSKSMRNRKIKKIILLLLLLVLLLLLFALGYLVFVLDKDVDLEENNDKDLITVSYVGDLILLKDQVVNSYNSSEKEYDFSYMFEKVKHYFDESDYTIGVFEGPISDSENGYSNSNYDDGVKLYLGFPVEFAEAVKEAGVDLVTTANNHLMDKGKEGVFNTIDYLDEVGLDHVGSYKSALDKNEIKVIEVEGVKIAVLSYTKFVNYYNSEFFLETEPNLTSVIVSEDSPYFEQVKKSVKEDFDRALEKNVDLIMVMPHMGTQFMHETDEFQNLWNDIFISYGADVILADHSHTTQSVEFVGDTLVVNCPGNFANSYVKNDGDATSIVEFYINKHTKEIENASVIPMYTRKIEDGKYQAVPIYDIYKDQSFYESFSEETRERIEKVHKIVTFSMLGEEVDIYRMQKKYFVFKDDYSDNISIKRALTKSKLKKILNSSSSVIFIGDSVTEGTMNGLHPWYEPLMELFPQIKINNISHGSYTTQMIINKYTSLISNSDSDIYFIALGTNDIRYRNKKICAMTPEEYIVNIDKITSLIDDDRNIVLIAPWTSLVNDVQSKLSYDKKMKMIEEYSFYLERYARERGYIYINPNKFINDFFSYNNAFSYLVDFIHPNSKEGIRLYSYAVLVDSFYA